MSNSRKRTTRRDRRKAKQSRFRRQPKKAGVVGHGTGINSGTAVQKKRAVKAIVREAVVDTLRVSISEFIHE